MEENISEAKASNLENGNISTNTADAKAQKNLPLGVGGPSVGHKQATITYLGLKNESSSFEIDLVTAREKGQEMRFLAITFSGIDVRSNEQQNSYINLDEEGFIKIKQFFQQLEWNS